MRAANPGAAALFGYTEQELPGLELETLVPPAAREAHRRLRAAFVADPRARPMGSGLEVRGLRRDGTQFDAEISLALLGDGDVLATVVDVTARNVERKALDERESLLRLFIEHAPAALAMFDREMRYLVASRRWITDYKLLGHDVMGRTVYEVLPELPRRWRDVHARCLAGSVEREEEDRFYRADGSIQWVRWEARPWRAASGKIGGIVIFAEEISERKHAERVRAALHGELDRQLRLLKTIVDNMPVALALLEGPEHRYALTNPAQVAMAGAKAPLVGRTVADVWPEAKDTKVMRLLDQVFSSGQPAHIAAEKMVLDRGAGAQDAYFNLDCLPLRDGGDRVSALLLMSSEITDSVISQREIQRTEQRFRATFEQAAVGIAHAALDGRFVRVNNKLCEIAGYDRDELLTKTWQDITHGEDLEADVSQMRRLLAGEIDHYGLQKRYVRKNGSLVWIMLTVSLLRHADGTPDYFIGVIEDIDARKNAERSLHNLRAEMEQMLSLHVASQTAAAIAHELNQPLNALAAYTEAALRMQDAGNPRPDRLVHALTAASAQAQRAGRVVRELMQFLQRGDAPREAVDVNALVQESLAMLEANGFSGFNTRVHLAPNMRRALVNRVQVEKVLVNLVRNGVEAMQEAGVATKSILITITTAASGDMALVSVTDSGPGLGPLVAARLFEPFFTTKPNGIGMGLTVSRALIEANGGRLWVDERVGSGATFHFTLPLVAPGADEVSGAT